MFIYRAELYCDSCGESLVENVIGEDTGDSDDWPQGGYPEEPMDGPYHCAGDSTCLERVDLRDYGLALDAELFGAETIFVGRPLGSLTEDGRVYMDEMMREPNPTPFQRALYALWDETYN